MSIFSFKKEAVVYIVHGGNRYQIDISTIDFSQTFTEKSYSTKTIQTQNMFEQSIINTANPANFTFTFPAIREDDLQVVFTRALDYAIFDLYIETQVDVFKLENCVVTNAAFIIEKLRPLSAEIKGEASQLSRAGDFGVFTVPGTPIARSGTRIYNRTSYINVLLGGVSDLEHVTSLTIELQNNIKWTPFKTVAGAIDAVDVSTSMFPNTFTLINRILSGTITRYFIDDVNWDIDTTLHIEAGQKVGGILFGFDFDLDNISFTNRTTSENIFTQSYDWRMTQNPDDLLEVMTYVTAVAGASGAIIDSSDFDILDSTGLAILDSS